MSLNFEQRMRMKSNQYAYSRAYERLKKAIEVNDNHEIYASIGELLMWVMNAHDWYIEHGYNDYEDRALKDDKGILLYGLRHAFNSMKHNMKFFTIHLKQEGFSFENMDFNNFDFRPITVHWIKEQNLLDEGKPNQIKNYKLYIEGKEVIETFDKAILFLNKEFQKIIFQ